MNRLPEKQDIVAFREFLDANGYTQDHLTKLVGSARPPRPESMQRMLHLTRDVTPANALIRLFLLGASLESETASSALPGDFIGLCERVGLLEVVDARLRATVVIVIVDDLLFASDAFRLLGTGEASRFVLPAGTHAADYLRHLTVLEGAKTVLDLGCGSGIHALLAARHCETVTATDVSADAVRYTKFNARLNGIDNVTCLQGDLFEPVEGQSFDLIISNPPFVLGPDQAFDYRDNPYELDGLCDRIISSAPRHLNEGGMLQMLCETVEVEGQAWPDRVREWFGTTGCDAWVLHGRPLHPVHYVAQRDADVVEHRDDSASGFAEWVAYLEARDVVAVHRAMVAMRRRSGRNWFHVHHFPGNVESDASRVVRDGIRACDFLEQCTEDKSLLDAVLMLAPELKLDQVFSRKNGDWRPESSLLKLGGGLPMDAEVDLPILAFLNQLDGRRSVREALEKFGRAVNADPRGLATELLPVVRLFIGRGFLLPAA